MAHRHVMLRWYKAHTDGFTCRSCIHQSVRSPYHTQVISRSSAMSNSKDSSPLALPELLSEVLGHLDYSDLFNAVLVNSTWATLGRGFLWVGPPLSVFGTLKAPRAQELANSVRYFNYSKGLGLRKPVPPEEGVSFPRLSMMTINNGIPHWSPIDIEHLLGPRITYFEYIDPKHHPRQLLKTLRHNCCNLKTLKITSGAPELVNVGEALEDMQHLMPLLHQCPRLIELKLNMGIENSFATELRLPTDVSQILGIARLRYVTLTGVLPQRPAKDLQEILSHPIANIQCLALSLVHPVDVISLLPHLRSIKRLQLGFDLVSASLDDMLYEISACDSLRELNLNLRSIAHPVSRNATLALRALHDLEVLNMWTGISAPFSPIISERDVIDLVASLPLLIGLSCCIDGLCFSSQDFDLWGASLQRLERFQLTMLLNITDLIPGLGIVHEESMVPLFPKLEVLVVDQIMPPDAELLERISPLPDGEEESEWTVYLTRLAENIAPLVLRHMPMLKDFAVFGVDIPPNQRTFAWDFVSTWAEIFEKAIEKGMEERDENVSIRDDTMDH